MPAAHQKQNLDVKIEDFLAHLEVEKGASPLTLRNYRHYLQRLLNYLSSKKKTPTIYDINQENVSAYRLYLSRLNSQDGQTLGRRTQGYHIIALRSLLKWLIKNDYNVLAPEKLDLPKVKDRQVKFLSGQEIDRLLSAPSLSKITGKRDKAILEVLFSTGLRVSELVKLDRDKIDLNIREFGIVGKGGKARVVFLSGRAAEWIKNYTDERKDSLKPLFIRHKGGGLIKSDEEARLTPRTIQRIVKKYARKVKLPKEATPHVIRHSFATDLLMAGADIRSVQEMLGHKNIATTQIYTHVTDKKLKEIHANYHGKS